MKYRLLVGAAEFWEAAAKDMSYAVERVLVQAMTFEGDGAGLGVANAVQASQAPDRRIIVDSYSQFLVNDRFVLSPALLERGFRNEVLATRRMFRRLEANGVGVSHVNPLGLMGYRYPLRNHKKLIVVDDSVSYIGGINFSDHNFAWDDLMLRIEGADAALFFRAISSTLGPSSPAPHKSAVAMRSSFRSTARPMRPVMTHFLSAFGAQRAAFTC